MRKPGRQTILTMEQEAIISEKLIFAALRGFAVDSEGIKIIMPRVAADVRSGGEMEFRHCMRSVLFDGLHKL